MPELIRLYSVFGDLQLRFNNKHTEEFIVP